MKLRKTMDRWDIETNYGYGWEVECSEYTRKDAKAQLKCYRENSYGRYEVRLSKHREKITRLYYYKRQIPSTRYPDNYAGITFDKTGHNARIVVYGRRLEETEAIEYGLELEREENAA